MRTMTSDSVVEELTAGLDALAAADVAALDDAALREQVGALVTVAHRVQAELVRRVDVFDRRGLAQPDGFRGTRAWLQAFGRLSGAAAHRLVKGARLLRRLPRLAAATQSGDVSPEHVQQVSRLVDRVGVEAVSEVEQILAEAASQLDPVRFATVCERVRAHVDPDGPDAGREFERRALTLSRVRGMLVLRGELDAEGGAALMTALDAVMTPPGERDERTAAQRRADALVELARRSLTAGTLPSVGGQRPQVGVLLYPQALSPRVLEELARAHRDDAAGARFGRLLAETGPESVARFDWTRPGVPLGPSEPASSFGRTVAGMRGDAGEVDDSARDHVRGPALDGPAGRRRSWWGTPGWADPPWLDHIGPVSPVIAQRIACDADIWRLIIDPATGMPLDVGRAHRLVPHWMRKALHARDRGCRWVGCTTPAAWTDAHHLQPWSEGGETSVDSCVLLCRHHHGLVHEGGWQIDLDSRTGEVVISRPGGIPYLVPKARSRSWTGPTTQAA